MKAIFFIFFILFSPFLQAKTIINEDFYDLDYAKSETVKIKVYDPFEKFNRKIHDFNVFFLIYFAKPFYTNIYSKVTNKVIRNSVHNLFINLKRPMIFVNYVLQLDFKNAGKTLYSFAIDTVYGVGGLRNVAEKNNVSVSTTNLGTTLGKYGIPAGPYLTLPFFGPNNLRGTLSWIAEILVNPIEFNLLEIGGKRDLVNDWIIYTKMALYTLDQMNIVILNYYDLMQTSFDSYVLMRDAYYSFQKYSIEGK